jgi:hypothetical protein
MLPTTCWFFWTSVFREYFLEPDQLETRIAYGGHAYKRIGTNGAFGQVVSEKKICLNRPIRKKNCLWRPRLLTDRDEMCNPYRGPSIDVFCQDLIQLAKRFQRRRLKKNSPIKIKICLWWLCLLTDQDRMSNLNRGTYMDASYQDSVHLAKRLQRRRCFRNRPIRNRNCLWRSCLLMDQDKLSNIHRGPYIDASCQVSFHLAKW